MTISGERTEQLDIFCRITGFTGDFLSFSYCSQEPALTTCLLCICLNNVHVQIIQKQNVIYIVHFQFQLMLWQRQKPVFLT